MGCTMNNDIYHIRGRLILSYPLSTTYMYTPPLSITMLPKLTIIIMF